MIIFFTLRLLLVMLLRLLKYFERKRMANMRVECTFSQFGKKLLLKKNHFIKLLVLWLFLIKDKGG
jgi:hypothetical protein